MRRFLRAWKQLGCEEKLDAHIVNYADDFVICCKGTARQADRLMRHIMERLRLTVNERKTRVCRLPDDRFDFLGYTIGRCYSPRTGKSYIGTRPSGKSRKRIFRKISDITRARSVSEDVRGLVRRLNSTLKGWSNYFCLGPVSKAYRAVDEHVRRRLRQWLRRKHKVRTHPGRRWPDVYLHDGLGLLNLVRRTRSFPWAKGI
jgi:hypothetical protein